MGKLQELARGYWWIGLFIIGGWMWLKDHDKIIRDSVRIQATADSITKEVNKQKEQIVVMRKADSIAAIKVSSLKAEVAERDHKLAISRVIIDSFETRLENAIPDSLRPLLDSLKEHYQERENQYLAQIRALSTLVAIRDSQVVAKDSVIARQEIMIDSINKKFDTYVHQQTHTSILHKSTNIIVKGLALYGGVELIKNLASQ